MSLTPPLPGHSLVPKVQYLALGGLEGDSSGENTEAGFQECDQSLGLRKQVQLHKQKYRLGEAWLQTF